MESELSLGTNLSKIVIAGHSQGGALALYTGLNHGFPQTLGGIVAMSTWLPLPWELEYTVQKRIERVLIVRSYNKLLIEI